MAYKAVDPTVGHLQGHGAVPSDILIDSWLRSHPTSLVSPLRVMVDGSALDAIFISPKVFIKSFCRSQTPHKFVK